VRELATKGAQIVLLTQHALNDPFLVDFIDDMRRDTKNELITAEQVDMESLHSIRTFATKWIDNAPPRRLDMIILCANTLTPSSKGLQSTSEGVELNWQVNYLANFHFLSILSPALRAQPPDRDVRVLFGNCSSYMGGDLHQVLAWQCLRYLQARTRDFCNCFPEASRHL
jgi:NAD(P)-dependent dehydrogenase (short-subunit alcohol dehydrogenase family)